jgi:hypothetical protein
MNVALLAGRRFRLASMPHAYTYAQATKDAPSTSCIRLTKDRRHDASGSANANVHDRILHGVVRLSDCVPRQWRHVAIRGDPCITRRDRFGSDHAFETVEHSI